MRNITRKVYTYDELTASAQARALENERTAMDDMLSFHLNEVLMDEMATIFSEVNLESASDTRLEYSLSYSQGDGLRIIGQIDWGDFYVMVKPHDSCIGSHYMHPHSVSFDFEGKLGLPDLEATPEQEKEFTELYVSVCERLAKYGYEYLEDMQSDKHLLESIKDNEYEFYEDGTLYSEDL